VEASRTHGAEYGKVDRETFRIPHLMLKRAIRIRYEGG